MYFRSLVGAALILAAGFAAAAEGTVEKNLRSKLAKLLPDHAPTSIRPAAMPGLYEVAFGAQLVYISADGRYLFQGSLIDIDKKTDLTEAARSGARKQALARLGEHGLLGMAVHDGKMRAHPRLDGKAFQQRLAEAVQRLDADAVRRVEHGGEQAARPRA